MSVGVFCDNGLKVVFDSTKVQLINEHDKIVLIGMRDHRKMYMLPMSQALSNEDLIANTSIFQLNSNARTIAQRVQFLSRTFGNAADSTLLTSATATHLKSVPNISAANIRKYPPNSIQ